MKQKLWCYLSVAICLLPFVWAVGDTFGIIQGSVDFTQEIYFEVSAQDMFLFNSSISVPQDGLYALSITIPHPYSEVTVVPVLSGQRLSSYVLRSGETKRINIQSRNATANQQNGELALPLKQPKVTSSSSSSFEFQPEENERMIQDIVSGNTQEHEQEVDVMPIPIIPSSSNEKNDFNSIKDKQEAQIFRENPSPIEKVNSFFLNPVVLLSIVLIACLLIVAVVLKGKRAKYL